MNTENSQLHAYVAERLRFLVNHRSQYGLGSYACTWIGSTRYCTRWTVDPKRTRGRAPPFLWIYGRNFSLRNFVNVSQGLDFQMRPILSCSDKLGSLSWAPSSSQCCLSNVWPCRRMLPWKRIWSTKHDLLPQTNWSAKTWVQVWGTNLSLKLVIQCVIIIEVVVNWEQPLKKKNVSTFVYESISAV